MSRKPTLGMAYLAFDRGQRFQRPSDNAPGCALLTSRFQTVSSWRPAFSATRETRGRPTDREFPAPGFGSAPAQQRVNGEQLTDWSLPVNGELQCRAYKSLTHSVTRTWPAATL